MYRLKAFETHSQRIVAPTGKTHTGKQPPSRRPQAPAPALLCPVPAAATAGTAAGPKGESRGGPGDPVPNHPQPIPVCGTGVLLAQGVQCRRHFGTTPLLPAPAGCSWPWGCSPALSCLHQGQTGPRCKLLVSRVGSSLPARGKGCRVQTAGSMPATLLGMSVGSAHPRALPPHPLPFPIPAPCLSPSLRHKPAGDREGDQACEMAGNLPTPACSSLAILLTSPSPERIDASAFELL